MTIEMDAIKRYKFEEIESIIYLGTRISKKQGNNADIKAKTAEEKKSVAATRKVLSSNVFSWNLKTRVYKTVVGQQRNKQVRYDQMMLKVCVGEKKLGKIYGGVKGEWERRWNQEL